MSAQYPFFNSQLGNETLSLEVSDQGFSGSDPTGQIAGAPAISSITISIDIAPVDNLPVITVPRATDSLTVDENSDPQLYLLAISEGLTPFAISDPDSDQCGICSTMPGVHPNSQRGMCVGSWESGVLTITLEVENGRLQVETVPGDNVTSVDPSVSSKMNFWANPNCSLSACQILTSSPTCQADRDCAWNGKECTCQSIVVGKMCSRLKFTAPQALINTTLQALRYAPLQYYNELIGAEALEMSATDKYMPENSTDTNFFCGDSSDFNSNPLLWKKTGNVNIQVRPMNNPPYVAFARPNSQPLIMNSGFEFPTLCEGDMLCNYGDPEGCVGVSSNANNWNITGQGGVTFFGWTGDAPSAEGYQHLYLRSNTLIPFSVAEQYLDSLVLGSMYQLTVMSSARNDLDLGCRLNVSVVEDQSVAPWIAAWTEGLVEDTTSYGTLGVDTWVPCRNWCILSTGIETAFQGSQGKEFSELTPIVFVAHSTQGILRIKADRESSQSGDRMDFVDNLQMTLVAKVVAEDSPFFLTNFEIFDPDLTTQFRNYKLGQADPSIIYVLTASAIHGSFILIQGPCDVLQPDIVANDKARIAFGDRCNVSSWARSGYSLNNCPQQCQSCDPPVPWSWVGDGTITKPCLRLPLTDYSLNIVATAGSTLGSTLLSVGPSHSVMLSGDPAYISQVLSSNFFFRPLLNFNTENLGLEQITFETNDKGNFAIPLPGGTVVEITNVTTIGVVIHAVNDPPTLEYTSKLTTYENMTLKVTGVSVNDTDVDEVMDSCALGSCASQDGIVLAQVIGNNGTIEFSPELSNVVNFSTFLMEDYNAQQDGILATPKVYQCTWRMWCDDTTSVLNQPTRGISYTSPCSTPTADNDFEECRDIKFPFCIFVRSIIPASLSVDYCNTVLTNIENEYSLTVFSSSGVNSLKRFQQKVVNVASSAPLFWGSEGELIFICTMKKLQNILLLGQLELNPSEYFNGRTVIDLSVSDLGHSGMEYPCLPPSDYQVGFPEALLWEHCLKSHPVVNNVASIFVPVEVLAVNVLPLLHMYDENGILQPMLNPLTVAQNTTVFIPRLEVFDPDFYETQNAIMNLELQVLLGGVLDCNTTKTPLLKVTFNFARNQILAAGNMDDINTLLSTITYISQASFVGVEVLYISVNDNGNTGAPLHGSGPQQFQIPITVLKPTVCVYDTCTACTSSTTDVCGWCPSDCGGRGKCRQATSKAGPPLYGSCSPNCDGGACMEWNMCTPPADTSYMIGSIGAPMVFVLVISIYFLIVWARQLYGTVPIYLIKCFESWIRNLRKQKLIPPETAKNVQLFYLYVFAVLAFISPYLMSFFDQVPFTLDLGEVTTLQIESDACKIYFAQTEQNYDGDAQAVLEAYVSANGTLYGLDGVNIFIDACSDVTTVQVVNTRLVNKYAGYSCEIIISVPQPTLSSQLPDMQIVSTGDFATEIRQDPSTVIDFGPHSVRFSGTAFDVDMSNIRTLFIGVDVQSGILFLRNSTFNQVVISTDSADVVLSPSNDDEMLTDSTVSMLQPSNAICLVSVLPDISGQVFSVINPCDRVCFNVTHTFSNNSNITTKQCNWSCSVPTQANLIPYTLTRSLDVPNRLVTMSSRTGQLYYTSVPDLRVPPLSGRTAVDSLLVYDGLSYGSDTRQPALSPLSISSMQEFFHPGGAPRPQQDYFIIEISGASKPQGQFVWVSDVRYLILDRVVLSILSIGLLVPSSFTATATLLPGFCPFFDMEVTSSMLPSANMITYTGKFDDQKLSDSRRNAQIEVQRMEYVKQIYSLLFEALDGPNFPTGSTLAYRPSENDPFVLFSVDSTTATIVTSQVHKAQLTW